MLSNTNYSSDSQPSTPNYNRRARYTESVQNSLHGINRSPTLRSTSQPDLENSHSSQTATSAQPLTSSAVFYQNSGSETEAERDLQEEIQATTLELADAHMEISALRKSNDEHLADSHKFKQLLSAKDEEINTLRDKIKRDASTISKHIRQNSQDILDEKQKDFLLRHLAMIREELTEILHQHPTDLSNAKERLYNLVELCQPNDKNLRIPNILNESHAKIRDLEELLHSGNAEKEYLQQRNDQLEEELDATKTENKKNLTELSEYVDQLNQVLKAKKQECQQLKDENFELSDAVEQQAAINAHSTHEVSLLKREVDQIEEQKIQVQKKYDQLLRQVQNDEESHRDQVQKLEEKLNDTKIAHESIMKSVTKLKEENQSLSDQLSQKLFIEDGHKIRRNMRHTSPITHTSQSREASEFSHSEIENA